MLDVVDIHTHTIASGHAYNTLREMATAAREKGLKLFGIAEHAPVMEGTFDEIYFRNFAVIPRHYCGVEIVMGVELNILNPDGDVDLPDSVLKNLDYAVASLHDNVITPRSKEENTRAIINAIKNPLINIIGHPDNPVFPVDFNAIAEAAAEHNTIIEINNSSYKPNTHRVGSRELSQALLIACGAAGANVIMSSDAHIDSEVGFHDYAAEMIAKANLPLERVLNYNPELLKTYLRLMPK